MKTTTLLVALTLATFAFATVLPAAAAEGPCPSNCTPPEPCGWAPDVRKNPVAWAQFWVDCAEDAPW